VQFIRQLLQIDPPLRPTAAGALAHPWLTTSDPLLTPLPTPGRLQALRSSGNLEEWFTHANELWLYSCATTPVVAVAAAAQRTWQQPPGSVPMSLRSDPRMVISEVRRPARARKRALGVAAHAAPPLTRVSIHSPLDPCALLPLPSAAFAPITHRTPRCRSFRCLCTCTSASKRRRMMTIDCH
jgi:serine/threonine protein kinase